MDDLSFFFSARVWRVEGKGGWYFVTLPADAAEAIRFFHSSAKGFMPVAVAARIGETAWRTSVFPDSKSGSYLLAIKADVRKSERIGADDTVEVTVKVSVPG